ncbi:MAG: hypothetical protein ACXAEF_02160 [Candidatus Thorarchaeota archaeon]|jgi:hypothetical protein
MSDKRQIYGVWLIERQTGRNIVSRAYSGIEIDMDLIAPFLSATHTFIDKASHENLRIIDTETSRYVWQENDYLLFVMVVSKQARVGHMRFILEYALNEFMRKEIPKEKTVDIVLSDWHGSPQTFKGFGNFVDELVDQYEETDEALIAGKSMDCLEVYSHLFRAILRVKTDKKTRKKLIKKIRELAEPVIESNPCLSNIEIDDGGVEVLSIDVYNTQYSKLRSALEEILRVVSIATKDIATKAAFRSMIFEHAMPYVKRDLNRLETYAILDDVIRYLF